MMKNGTPRSDVNMPMGISTDSNRRAISSTTSKNDDPMAIDAGRSTR